MSADLVLWRHAEATPCEAGQDDESRDLTAKGHRQARKMGEWLDAKLPNNCLILCSPAIRAVQTAEALGRKYKLVTDLAPDTAIGRILTAAAWPDAHRTVLLVGHQPALGRLAAHLLVGGEQNWTVRKANVWWIRRRPLADARGALPAGMLQNETYLRAVLAPCMIRK